MVDFAVLTDHRIKLKESEKKDKYLDLAWELKKLWNMKVTKISITIGALVSVTRGLVQGLEDLRITRREETVQVIALLRCNVTPSPHHILDQSSNHSFFRRPVIN